MFCVDCVVYCCILFEGVVMYCDVVGVVVIVYVGDGYVECVFDCVV